MPQNDAGIRMEPPPSVPTASGPSPAATAAPAPPLDPPGVSSRFHGFRVIPKSGLSVDALVAELRRGGLAEDDAARALQPLDDDGVLLRDMVGKEARAAGGQHPPRPDQVLHRERHAVQRTELLAGHHRHLGGHGGVARLVGGDGAEAVEAAG